MKQPGEELQRLLRSYLDGDDEHPDLEDVLFRHTDGSLDQERRAEVDAHLEHCARCREDVSDAVAVQRSIGRRRHRIPWLIAAAVAAIAVAAALWWPRGEQPMTPPAVHTAAAVPSEWSALVQQARTMRRIDPPPALRALHVERDTLRGHPAPHASGTFSPSDTVIETQEPTFRWPAVKNAAYEVRIFEKEKEIARSPVVRDNRWTLPKPLARGVTYVWQVEVQGAGVTILPAPPDPPALFMVLGSTEAAEIDEARRRFPGDHLLAGVLYARAGVRDRAEDEIGRWIAAHPADSVARDLLASIQEW
jgi:hypothetical protein